MRPRTRSPLAAVPIALTLALALAGCGSGGSGSKVASVNGGKGSSASATQSLSPDEMAVKFTQCLREHGLGVDDPEPGKGVRLTIDGGVSKAKVDKAMRACRKYDPAQNGALKNANPEGQENMRKYAQCMRKNGVQDFPDPKGAGLQVDGSVMDDPDFKKADKKCQPLMGKGGTTHTEKG
jgi:hypothetical protein